MIVKRTQDRASPDEDAYDSVDASEDHVQVEPPPSYEAASSSHTTLSNMDAKTKGPASDMSIGNTSPQIPFDDLITGSSTHLTLRRSLPAVPQQPASVSEAHEGQRPEASPESPHSAVPFHEPSGSPVLPREPPPQPESPSNPPVRPQLPHAARSAPDTRGRARLEHIQELEERDQFGNTVHDESPFAAARRAQQVDNGTKNDSDPRSYINGRMPSFKPGEIIPVNTMRPATGAPPFFPPHQAPAFPPISHPPIRPAHFPLELHPPVPPPQPTRTPSYRQPPPPQPPQPLPSHSHGQSPPAPAPQPQPQPPSQPSRALSYRQPPPPPPPQATRSYSHGPPASVPPPPQPPNASPPSQLRRHTYDPRSGVPPSLTPGGRHAASQPYPGAPHPAPQGYPQSHPQAHPSGSLIGPAPQAYSHYQNPPPSRSILREPQRRSVQHAPMSSSPLAAPAPTPVRLPSQNVQLPSPHALGIVHAPPSPSGSPRPDPNRAPRSTPKPVMPQLLEPLVAKDHNYGRSGSTPLQRSASVMPLPSEKGGLLSKTRSILRKRSLTSGIKTHADGAITYASQPHPSKRYENQSPGLTPLKEESGMPTGKSGKRLSKRK